MGSRLASAAALALACLLLVGAVAPPAVAAVALRGTAAPAAGTAPPTPSAVDVAEASSKSPSVAEPATAPGAASVSSAAASADEDIVLTKTLALTPDRPGSVRVTLRYELPDEVVALETEVDPDARDVETDGFDAAGGSAYEWDGVSDVATITYRLPANVTAESGQFAGGRPHATASRLPAAGERGPIAADRSAAGPASSATAPASSAAEPGEGYLFVDAGPWALVRLPRAGVSWRYRGATVGLVREARVDGAGAVGGQVAFLGAHETHERTAHGQTFRLVVPEASSMAASPEAVLDSYAAAADSLRVGDRDPSVFVVAAPADVDWAVRGLQTGDADAWVRADESLDGPDAPWLHEYVHTRQSFETAEGARWVVEGSADYYAALLALRQDRIGFEAFADHLAVGEREPYADAVLAEPGTWARGANYRKGALVVGALDRRIRLASDGSASFATVLQLLNEAEEPVTADRFVAAVRAVSDDSVAEAAERYVRTDAVPEMWTEDDHERAFGALAARVEVVVPAALHVGGPYRNATLTAPATLATGETVALPVGLVNDGDDPADYRLRLAVDGRTVATTNGTLAAGGNETVRLSWTATEPGTYDLALGRQSYPITVREPASPAVASLSTERSRVAAGGSALVVAELVAPGDVPAAGELAVRVDGERVGSRRVSVAPGERTTIRFPVSLPGPGSHAVSVGNRTVTVTVATPTPAATSEPTQSPGAGEGIGTDGGPTGDGSLVSTPGFGASTAVLALLAAATLAVVGSRRRD